ncbi:MAG TPA: Gfo/Idh/MocA family oxidoreductase [Longimicrobiales bacterium]|nr:Gfo/Idh/MocA family oxidoreductase [Longimicrobiales bacterium]
MSARPELSIGLLGTGAIAQIVHLPMLAQFPGARVGAVCDVDYDKAKALASRFEIPRVHRQDDAVFADPEIQAVLICTPSYLHEEQAIAAMRAGKHVLVEKPLALTPEGVERVLRVAEETGRAIVVAMNNRYRPDALALKPFARGGELGDVFFLKAGWLNRKVRLSRPTWRHRRATAGGGALMDLGIQILDLALWMLDYPSVRRVVAHLHPAEGVEVEDSAAVLCTLEDGPILSLEVTWSLLGKRDRHYLELHGTHGSGSLSPLAVYKELEHGLVDVTPQVQATAGNAYTASYRQLLRHFLDVTHGDRAIELPYDQVRLMRLIRLAYQSAEEGREIEA